MAAVVHAPVGSPWHPNPLGSGNAYFVAKMHAARTKLTDALTAADDDTHETALEYVRLLLTVVRSWDETRSGIFVDPKRLMDGQRHIRFEWQSGGGTAMPVTCIRGELVMACALAARLLLDATKHTAVVVRLVVSVALPQLKRWTTRGVGKHTLSGCTFAHHKTLLAEALGKLQLTGISQWEKQAYAAFSDNTGNGTKDTSGASGTDEQQHGETTATGMTPDKLEMGPRALLWLIQRTMPTPDAHPRLWLACSMNDTLSVDDRTALVTAACEKFDSLGLTEQADVCRKHLLYRLSTRLLFVGVPDERKLAPDQLVQKLSLQPLCLVKNFNPIKAWFDPPREMEKLWRES